MNTKLRDALSDAGMSQSRLARHLDIHPSRVNRWVQGKELPTYAQLVSMMELLDGVADLGYAVTPVPTVTRSA